MKEHLTKLKENKNTKVTTKLDAVLKLAMKLHLEAMLTDEALFALFKILAPTKSVAYSDYEASLVKGIMKQVGERLRDSYTTSSQGHDSTSADSTMQIQIYNTLTKCLNQFNHWCPKYFSFALDPFTLTSLHSIAGKDITLFREARGRFAHLTTDDLFKELQYLLYDNRDKLDNKSKDTKLLSSSTIASSEINDVPVRNKDSDSRQDTASPNSISSSQRTTALPTTQNDRIMFPFDANYGGNNQSLAEQINEIVQNNYINVMNGEYTPRYKGSTVPSITTMQSKLPENENKPELREITNEFFESVEVRQNIVPKGPSEVGSMDSDTYLPSEMMNTNNWATPYPLEKFHTSTSEEATKSITQLFKTTHALTFDREGTTKGITELVKTTGATETEKDGSTKSIKELFKSTGATTIATSESKKSIKELFKVTEPSTPESGGKTKSINELFATTEAPTHKSAEIKNNENDHEMKDYYVSNAYNTIEDYHTPGSQDDKNMEVNIIVDSNNYDNSSPHEKYFYMDSSPENRKKVTLETLLNYEPLTNILADAVEAFNTTSNIPDHYYYDDEYSEYPYYEYYIVEQLPEDSNNTLDDSLYMKYELQPFSKVIDQILQPNEELPTASADYVVFEDYADIQKIPDASKKEVIGEPDYGQPEYTQLVSTSTRPSLTTLFQTSSSTTSSPENIIANYQGSTEMISTILRTSTAVPVSENIHNDAQLTPIEVVNAPGESTFESSTSVSATLDPQHTSTQFANPSTPEYSSVRPFSEKPSFDPSLGPLEKIDLPSLHEHLLLISDNQDIHEPTLDSDDFFPQTEHTLLEFAIPDTTTQAENGSNSDIILKLNVHHSGAPETTSEQAFNEYELINTNELTTKQSVPSITTVFDQEDVEDNIEISETQGSQITPPPYDGGMKTSATVLSPTINSTFSSVFGMPLTVIKTEMPDNFADEYYETISYYDGMSIPSSDVNEDVGIVKEFPTLFTNKESEFLKDESHLGANYKQKIPPEDIFQSVPQIDSSVHTFSSPEYDNWLSYNDFNSYAEDYINEAIKKGLNYDQSLTDIISNNPPNFGIPNFVLDSVIRSLPCI